MPSHTTPSRTAVRLALEVISIVFGVSLALGLAEWREGVKTRRLVDAVLENLAGEAAANREAVHHSLDYHRRALESMRGFAGEREPGTVGAMLDEALPNGLVAARVRGSAWNTAIASNVVPELPYELVRVLSSGYMLQARYERLTDGFVQAVYQSLLSSDILARGSAGDVVDAIAPAVGDILEMEQEISGVYDALEGILAPDLDGAGAGG